MSELTVACVLRTEHGDHEAKRAGEAPYDASYVRRLRRQVAEHLSLDYTFCCLTDLRQHFARTRTVWLEHDWPGWWAKIELFRPGLFRGRVLYLDLDTSVVGSLDGVAGYKGSFGMLEDFYRPGQGASGVMAWAPSPRTERIYTEFAQMAEGAMQSHRGDQNWISGSVEWADLRSLYPGQIVSRWEHCADGVPEESRIVAWHGEPKPAEIGWELEGSRGHWRERVA